MRKRGEFFYVNVAIIAIVIMAAAVRLTLWASDVTIRAIIQQADCCYEATRIRGSVETVLPRAGAYLGVTDIRPKRSLKEILEIIKNPPVEQAPRAHITRISEEEYLEKLLQKHAQNQTSRTPNLKLPDSFKSNGFDHDLAWVKDNYQLFFSAQDIDEMSRVIGFEDENSGSDTEWAAHAWAILSRLGRDGFAQNDSIHGLLTAPRQFSSVNTALQYPVNPDIREVVIDVVSRYILECNGYSATEVSRVVPASHVYWRADGSGIHNTFYDHYESNLKPFRPIKDAVNTPYDT